MKPVAWMAGAGAIGWLMALALFGTAVGRDVLLGLLGPLAAACGSWILMERTYRARPERLTAVMMAAFCGKLVFFGAYVAVMVRAVVDRPVPFVVSFTAYFIGLYAIEALLLKRLFAGGRSA
jgi:hypothetical protein